MSALVTNTKNRIGYCVTRSLAKKSIKVTTSDYFPFAMSFYSRYSNDRFVYPSPYAEPEAFISCLIREINSRKPKALLPTYDETFLISKHHDAFYKIVCLALPTFEQIESVHSKKSLYLLAEKLDIKIPRFFVPQNSREVDTLDDIVKERGMQYPLLLKPVKGGGAWGVLYIKQPGGLANHYRNHCQLLKTDEIIIQEQKSGKVNCTAMILNQGELRAQFSYRQLRDYPVSGGAATVRESIYNENTESSLFRLLAHLGWHGVCQADFIHDEISGDYYLLDVNPRLWGSVYQAVASGIDFPYLLYLLATEGDINKHLNYKIGIRTRWIWGDLRAFKDYIKMSQHKVKDTLDFMNLFDHGIAFDDFDWRDPLPFFVFPFFYMRQAFQQRTLHPDRGGI